MEKQYNHVLLIFKNLKKKIYLSDPSQFIIIGGAKQ